MPCQLPEGSSEAKGASPKCGPGYYESFSHYACEVGHASGPDTCPSTAGVSGFFLPDSPWPDANPASTLWLWGKKSSALQGNAKAIEGNMQKHSLELM